MIQNERQYKVTKGQIARLEDALKAASKAAGKMDTRVYQAMVSGIESQIQDMSREVEEFKNIHQTKVLTLPTMKELGKLLNKARLARNYTQKDLARKVNLNPQQIQKYEITRYRSASLKRILEIMKALDIDLREDIILRPVKETKEEDLTTVEKS